MEWVECSRRESVSSRKTRRVRVKRIEFIGWGSKPLIEFLEAIEQDTSKAHSRREVVSCIRKYINANNLADGKKKVRCDERLYALFGKMSISQKRLYNLLEEHFSENHADSDDESLDASEEESRRKKSCLGRIPSIHKVPKSCFAAVIPDNVKLIYLKKSLIRELLKVPESFEIKILGSFVRMKADPYDLLQNHPFHLQLVTGIENFSAAVNADADKIQLKVANFYKEVPFSMLSDDNFSKEEVEDVQKRIEAGALKKFTVNEIELKARLLHADITKHSIAKELALLEKRIEHANDKGWKRELDVYRNRRKMLQTTSEVEKLLSKIPEVIAEELFSECATVPVPGSSDTCRQAASESLHPPAPHPLHDSHAQTFPITVVDAPLPVRNADGDKQEALAIGAADTTVADIITGDGKAMVMQMEFPTDTTCDESRAAVDDNNMTAGEEKAVVLQTNFSTETTPEVKQDIRVIELSDDEESEEDNKLPSECVNAAVWHYADPRGKIQGPFSLQSLKRWNDANYFHSGFMVWKSNQTTNDGVLLVDVLRRSFPKCYL